MDASVDCSAKTRSRLHTFLGVGSSPARQTAFSLTTTGGPPSSSRRFLRFAFPFFFILLSTSSFSSRPSYPLFALVSRLSFSPCRIRNRSFLCTSCISGIATLLPRDLACRGSALHRPPPTSPALSHNTQPVTCRPKRHRNGSLSLSHTTPRRFTPGLAPPL